MWQGIQGHDEVVERFRRSLQRGRLASTFLFVGPAGIGKRTFALKLAQALLCQNGEMDSLDPCGACDNCLQAVAGVHPDLLLVAKPADKSFIPLSLFVGDEQRRMREGLCHDIGLKPFMGGRRIALIDDADYLNEEGANALLKTLEEPPPRSVLILIGTSADKQLPTIRSRSQIVSFRPLADDVVADLLVSQGLIADPVEARRLSQFSEGSLERAVELADPELWQFRQELLGQFAKSRFDSVQFARRTIEFIDAAGKEAAARRNRTRQIIRFAVDFFRQRMRVASGLAPVGDADLCRAAESATDHGDLEQLAALADRSLEALIHVDRNAHQAALVECWLDDLAEGLAGRASGRAMLSSGAG
jgi:DNA polymerase-3 subunit delta'